LANGKVLMKEARENDINDMVIQRKYELQRREMTILLLILDNVVYIDQKWYSMMTIWREVEKCRRNVKRKWK